VRLTRRFEVNAPTREQLCAIAQRVAGLHYESPAARAVIDPTDWDSYYPEIDGDGYLTGDIVDCTSSDADSYINVGDDVLVREDALSQEQLQDVDEGRMGGIPEEVRA
jgi:hypothetical protein